MKVYVVFALFAVALAGKDLCKHGDAELDDSEQYRELIRTGSTLILGHCSSFDIDAILFSGECKPLFDQAFCYAQIAKAYYGPLEVVSYGDLAKDLPRIQHLGELACDHARGCIDAFKDAFRQCKEEDADFVNTAIANVESVYRSYGEELVTQFAEENSDTLIGELISLVLSRFQSVDDIREAIEEYVTDDIISDAEAAIAAVRAAAVEWCEGDCNTETAAYLKRLLKFLNKKKCVDAAAYCGECSKLGNRFLKKKKNKIPCCLDNLIKQVASAVDYVKETYNDMITDFKTYLSDSLSEDAVDEAAAIRDRVVKEIKCLKKSVDNYHGYKWSNYCEAA